MFRTLAIALLATSLSFCSAKAADKGGPPVKVTATGEVKNFNGCYLSAAGSATFLEVAGLGEAARMFLAGAGCDMQRGQIVFGASGEYGIGEEQARMAALSARFGLALNDHTLLYAITSLTMDGRDIKVGDSIWSLGAGLETYLLSKNWTVFVEGQTAIKAFGAAGGVDLSTAKIGVRYRF
jgi:opacity protein-like surface antigen